MKIKVKVKIIREYELDIEEILKYGKLKLPIMESFSKSNFNKYFYNVIKKNIEIALENNESVIEYVLLNLFDNDLIDPNLEFINLFMKNDYLSLTNENQALKFKLLYNEAMEGSYINNKFYFSENEMILIKSILTTEQYEQIQNTNN